MEQNDNVDITDQNIIGAIDHFATNIALAGLAILPSFLIVIFAPWRLTPMVIEGRPDGRSGLLLAPGIFFLLIVVLTILLTASIAPEATSGAERSSSVEGAAAEAQSSRTLIGGEDISRMAEAWRAGDINQILMVLLPVFAICVITSASSAWLRVIVGGWWSIRTAIRSGFYIFGAIIGLAAVFSWIPLLDLSSELTALISAIFSFGILAVIAWCLFGIFKAGSANGTWRAIGGSLLATATMTGTSTLVVLLFL